MTFPSSEQGPGRRPRRGALMLIAMVCVAVAAVVFVSVLRLAVAERRAVRLEAEKVQADWLVESGIERAAARLGADADYAGETWQVSAELLGGKDPAAVRIEVRPVREEPDRRTVDVEVDYPDHPRYRVRRTKQILIDVRREIAGDRR